jgi:hypothetical protein
MECPHCNIHIYEKKLQKTISSDQSGCWGIIYQGCPSCNNLIIWLAYKDKVKIGDGQDIHFSNSNIKCVILPTSSIRSVPSQVPEAISQDFIESASIVCMSPKASATLSRRCLQHILIDAAKVNPKSNLDQQIQEAIDQRNMPSYISDMLDSVRMIGNFAAHPSKSITTGIIIEVEPEEANYNLYVIEQLFDFYYVKPSLIKERKDQINAKILDSGKTKLLK